jgi:hypothetical protein
MQSSGGMMAMKGAGSLFSNMGKAQSAGDPGKVYKPGTGHVGPNSKYFPGYERLPQSAGAGMQAMGDTMTGAANTALDYGQAQKDEAFTQKIMEMLMNNQYAQSPGMAGRANVAPTQ